MKTLENSTIPYTRQNKAAAVIAVLLMLLAYLHADAQNNPFKIQDNLYTEYQRLFAIRSTQEVLDGAERLYHQATLQGDSKAGCIALTLPLQYHFHNFTTLEAFDKCAERLKSEAMRTGYLQYYFFASTQRVSVFIKNQLFLLAIQTTKKHKEDAERLDNDYGRYTFIRCMAKIHEQQDDQPKAMEYYIRAYEFAKEKQMNQDMAPLCGHIADTYKEQGFNDKALEWCERGLADIANKNNTFPVVNTKLQLLFTMGKKDEFLSTYNKYKEYIDQRKKTLEWYKIEARRLCCEGRQDEALKMASEHNEMGEWAKLRYNMAIQNDDYRKAIDYQRDYYTWFAKQHVGLSDPLSMSELDATMETERLNLEKIQLEYANAQALLKNAEADKSLKTHETANMRMKAINDSAAMAQLKLDSAIAAKKYAANASKENTARTLAERRQTTEAFAVTVAILLLIAAVVAVIFTRRRMKATKRHNAELKAALDKAKQTQVMQDSFINNMSLEVRKPLNDIVGYARTLLDRPNELTTEQKTDISDGIGQNAEKLSEMVNVMLKKALEESTGKTSKAIATTLLFIFSAIPAMALETHGEISKLLAKNRTLRALTIAHEAHEKALKAQDWKEAYATACDLSVIYKKRYNTTRSTEYAEEALSTWRKHNIGGSPADVMLTLGRQYRQFYKLDKASDILNEAAPYCTTDAQRLELLTESAHLSFERGDSASFMAEYALTMKQKASMSEEDKARLEVERSFFKNHDMKALEKYGNKLTLQHRQSLQATMFSHLGQWDKASKTLADAMHGIRNVRASIYEADRKEMEDEADNRKLEADNARLQLEHAQLQLEEQAYRLGLEEKLAESMQLEAKNDELRRKRLATSNADILARMMMDKRHTEEMEAKNKLSDIRAKTTIGLTAIVVLLVLAYLIAYRRSLKAMKAKNSKLDMALKEAEKAEEEKNAFIQSVSHEIRTPLNAIMGFSQIMSDTDYELSDEERNMFSTTISRNADLLTEIVYDIINASELDNDKKAVEMEDVFPHQLCHKAMDLVKHRVNENVPVLFSTTTKESITVRTNGRYVTLVLTHFLTNAIKHTTEGQITIGCTTDEYPGNVCFYVQDTGCGIPADKREAVFERFFKIDTFQQGIGIGLNICKRIAERLNARILVDPEYNSGARFLLIVPIK